MSDKYYNDLTSDLRKKYLKERVGAKESRVLIIYTGGTIGMIQSDEGYVPATNVFAEALKKNPSFHDQEEHSRRLLTANYSEDLYVTPLSFFGKRIVYKLIEMTPLIDSSCMQTQNRLEIAEMVEQNYYDYDGFLVLHGTDTMAYTASALSFIFENLQKPVVLTGAQISYFEVRNDAAHNLLEALTIAGHFNIPEVCLFFNNKLFRGNRSTKTDNSNFDAYQSPNCSYLVKSGISYKVKWDIIRHPQNEGRFCIQKQVEESISILHFFPIITLSTIKAACQEPIKAVVILSYGAGNIPSNKPEFIKELESAVARGVVVLNITQCTKGGTSADYQCGRILQKAGVVLGGDMTLECAVTKISYLLGKFPNNLPLVKKLLRENLRGEMTIEHEKVSFSYNMQNILADIGDSLGLYSQQEKLQVFQKCVTMLSHSTAYDGFIDKLKKLHDDNISMELKDPEGKTLLHIACRMGNLELVQFLLSVKVSVNPVDLSGHTPLFLAIQRDFIKISELLIEKGGEIRNKPEVVAQVLCDAASTGNLTKLVLFIQAGVNIQVFDYQGRTCAHAAVATGQSLIVRYLKQSTNFNWYCQDILGFTPLNIAERLGNTEIISLLTD